MHHFKETNIIKPNFSPYILLELIHDSKKWVKYNDFYFKTILSHYILTDDLEFIDTFDLNNYEEWLYKNWNKLLFISNETECTLEFVIQTEQYTIINGLTLILGLHKINIIKMKSLFPIFQKFVATNILYQEIPEIWNHLYYNVSYNIADFPLFYLSTGPHWAHEKIIDLFRAGEIEPFYNHSDYTSCYSCMLPHFNINHWKSHNRFNKWLETELSDVSIYPKVKDFFIAITSKKSSYKFFVNNSY
ncbi:MAG: hypothetical protein EBS55_10015 [Flavobacteriaceae bacterium]|nr:hypothetical protein [Flavobacteriaceae bacterium]